MNTPTLEPETSPRGRTALYVGIAALAGAIVAGTVVAYVVTQTEDESTTAASTSTRSSRPATATTKADSGPAFVADLRAQSPYTLTNTDESLISTGQKTADTFVAGRTDEEWRANYEAVRNILVESGFYPDVAKLFIVTAVKHFSGEGVYQQTKRLAAGITELRTMLTAGMYIVGKDAAAGTYKTEGASRCYYALHPSVTSTEILENKNLDGQGYFAASDGQGIEVRGSCVFKLQK